jgi:CheY-like chemotaxis protein
MVMKKVLVIDDEFEILHALQMILEDEQYEVLTGNDGKAGVDLLSQSKPDLVITDIMMPRLSGYEVVKFMKENEELQNIPVVLMSAANPQVKQSKYNWDYFLRKPFDIDELINITQKLIGS